MDGSDGYPAVLIKSNSDIKSPYRTILPEKLYEFSIMATIRPETRTGGYLFSVVNPLDTLVQLGLFLSPIVKDKWNVTILYADATSPVKDKMSLASFEMPYSKKWLHIAFKVMRNKITFFSNCIETETVTVERKPVEMVFDSASTFYLAQAGPILKGHFEVSCFFSSIYIWIYCYFSCFG